MQHRMSRGGGQPRSSLYRSARGGAGGAGTVALGEPLAHEQEAEALLRRENERYVEELGRGAGQLKEISIAIHQETERQNAELERMRNSMNESQSFLGQTMDRLQSVMRTATPKHFCYLVLFMLAVFFILYYMTFKM